MPKQILFNEESRLKLKKGVDTLADAVKVTLGAKGRNVIIGNKYALPHITKDGVTVAKSIDLKCQFENMGAQLVKDVASKTNDVAGDGTTSSVVLTQAILERGFKAISSGSNPIDVKHGIDLATQKVVGYLKKNSLIVSDNWQKISDVATISANNDREIGELIADAFKKVTTKGTITVEESRTAETTFKVVDGMQFDKGYLSPYFITNPSKMEVEYQNPYILICNQNISSIKDLIPVLEGCIQQKRPLLIIANNVEGEALSTLVVNKMQGNIPLVAVKTPGFGESKLDILEDLAILVGGEIVTDELGSKLETHGKISLGSADKIIVTKDSTTIVGGKGVKSKVQERISQLESLIKDCDSEYQKDKLRERVSKLSGGVGILYVGANTEVEMKEKKDRIVDAIHATRAAIEEGINIGGGVALLKASKTLSKTKVKNADQQIGIDIIKEAIQVPFEQILSNAGVYDADIKESILNSKYGIGYNVKTFRKENLLKSGVIDPTMVTRNALENASSVASMILTAECAIVDDDENIS